MSNTKKISKNVQTVLDILQDEVNGDVASALKKMTKDYSMTWVDSGDGRACGKLPRPKNKKGISNATRACA